MHRAFGGLPPTKRATKYTERNENAVQREVLIQSLNHEEIQKKIPPFPAGFLE